MKLHLLTLCLLGCYTPGTSSAQTSQPLNEEKVIVSANRYARNCFVKLDSEQSIANLMVMVWDHGGNLIYHETRFDFKGHFERTIDLSGTEPGKYQMKISADEQKISRELSMH